MVIYEHELTQYIEHIYEGQIIAKDFDSALQVYIPEKQVMVCYERNLNMEKMTIHLRFNAKTILYISEQNWLCQRAICKSMIASALGIYKSIYNAKDCLIMSVSEDEAKEFLDANHLDGNIEATDRFGLYYDGNLVQLICVNNSKAQKEPELCRMCTRLNTLVVDGFSTLIDYANNPHLK